MSRINLVYSKISKAFKIMRLNRPVKGLRILIYHSVYSESSSQDGTCPFSVSEDNFIKQLKVLKNDSHFNLVHFNSTDLDYSKMNIAITFDDGFLDNLTVASAHLEVAKIPYTVFVTSDNVFKQGDEFLNEEQLMRLSQLPHCQIGSHGKTHHQLDTLSPEKMYLELKDSKEVLEKIISKEIDTISYPHGAYNSEVIEKATNLRYKFGATSFFKTNKNLNNSLELGRVVIMNRDSEQSFYEKVMGFWDWYYWAQVLKGGA